MLTDDIVREAVKEMLVKVSEPLSPGDLLIVDRATVLMKQRFLHGWNQLVSIGSDAHGSEHHGIQLDVPIGQDSICAEILMLSRFVQAQQTLAVAVTVRHRKREDGGDVHVVGPCAACRERILHFFRDARIIVPIEGRELVKVPIRALYPVPYKEREKPNGNGSAAQIFSSS